MTALPLRLAIRAVRWRLGSSIAILLVAAAAVLAASLGPAYSATASSTLLADRLAQTPRGERDLTVIASESAAGGSDVDAPLRRVADVASSSRWFGPLRVEHATTVTLRTAARLPALGRIASLESGCAHLSLTEGRCPRSNTEALLSARSAAFGHWRLGDVVRPATETGGVVVTVRLVGFYRIPPATAPFWSPWPLFDARASAFDNRPPQIDSFLVPPGPLTVGGTLLQQTATGSVPLELSKVRLGDEDGLRAVVRRADSVAQQQTRDVGAPVTVGTQLNKRLDVIDHEISVSRTLVDLAIEQLAVLAVIVLGGIVAASAGARGGEVALGKLRGRRPTAVAAQALLEPVSLILLAAPIGAVSAWLVVRAAAKPVFGPGHSVVFPASAYGLAATATGAAVVVAGLAGRRMLAAPVGDLLRRGPDGVHDRSLGLVIADVAVVALAAASLAQLVVGGVFTGGRPNPLAALAPTLLAAAVAVLGLRLLPHLLRLAIRRRGRGTGLVGFLAVRQIGRRPRGARMALLVAVATSLAIVAVTTWSMAARNREYRARNEVGASTVLTVTPRPGVDLLKAVRTADPSGSGALAAAMLPVSNTQMLAVDSARLRDIAAWRPDYATPSLPTIAKLLTPRLPRPVVLRGSSLTAQVRLTTPTDLPMALTVALTRADHVATSLHLGPLHPGRRQYRAALPFGCSTGCRVTGLSVDPANPAQLEPWLETPEPSRTVQLSMSDLVSDGTGTGDLARLLSARFWRSVQDSSLTASASGAGLDLTSPQPDSTGTWGSLASADLPAALPGIVAPETKSVYPGASIHNISATNLDGNGVAVDGLVLAKVLPMLGHSGVIVDLGLAEQAMTGQESGGVVDQVWLSPSAPRDLVQRLQRQGLRVDGRQTSAAERTRLDHTGPAWADVVFAIAAVAAAALAVAAALLAGLLVAGRRAYEYAGLEAVGVPRRTVRAAIGIEQAIVAGMGLVLGVAAGIGGAALALRSTPVFVDEGAGPPVETALPIGPTVLVVIAMAVALMLCCVVVAIGITRRATADRLREAAP